MVHYVFIRINFPGHVDNKYGFVLYVYKMYVKGSQVEISNFYLFLSLGIVFILANSSDPDGAALCDIHSVCERTCLQSLQNGNGTIQ